VDKRIQEAIRGEEKKLVIRSGSNMPHVLLPVDFTITDPMLGEIMQTLTFLYKDQQWHRVIARNLGPDECVLTYVRATVTECMMIDKHLGRS
jgi:hypothetical protein